MALEDPGRRDLEADLTGSVINRGASWVVTCTRASRLTDPPTIQVYVDTELTRVPAKQQAETKALAQLKALGVRFPEVRSSRPAGPNGEEAQAA